MNAMPILTHIKLCDCNLFILLLSLTSLKSITNTTGGVTCSNYPLTIMKLDRVCVIQMHGALPEYFLGRMPWSCHSPSIRMTAGSSNPPCISSQTAIPKALAVVAHVRIENRSDFVHSGHQGATCQKSEKKHPSGTSIVFPSPGDASSPSLPATCTAGLGQSSSNGSRAGPRHEGVCL